MRAVADALRERHAETRSTLKRCGTIICRPKGFRFLVPLHPVPDACSRSSPLLLTLALVHKPSVWDPRVPVSSRAMPPLTQVSAGQALTGRGRDSAILSVLGRMIDHLRKYQDAATTSGTETFIMFLGRLGRPTVGLVLPGRDWFPCPRQRFCDLLVLVLLIPWRFVL